MGMLSIGFVLVVLLVLAVAAVVVIVLVLSQRRSTQQTEPVPLRFCPQCGRPLPADAPQGLCPACLLRGGIASQEPSQQPLPPTLPPKPRACPQCGVSMPDDAPPGPCPKCQAVIHEQSTASGAKRSYQGPFVAPTPAELAPLFPQLEVIEMLGRGGMGAVYKCRQPHLDRLVALKILPPESGQDPTFAERFAREAKTLAKLNHPNIVSVHDYGFTAPSPSTGEGGGGYYYFLMEYVDGANLRQIIRGGQLKPNEALRIVPQICDALQFAHDEGVVHRDIKPENILVDKRGRVKIADFGLAKLVGASALESGLTGTMQVMGTLYYMAPEQMERPKEVDHRADIYSLGVVFYELLTGQLPVGNFPRPSQKVQVDVRLDEVVLRALEHEPQRRYQHASDVKTEVEAISSGAQLAASPAPSYPQVPLSAPFEVNENLRQRVAAPAIGLIVVGGLQCLLALVPLLGGGALLLFLARGPAGTGEEVITAGLAAFFPLQGEGPAARADYPLWLPIVGGILLSNILGIVVLIGGMQMYRLQSYGLAVAASILAMLPCGPVFILGLPLGLWALFTLRRPEVQEAFVLERNRRRGLNAPASRQELPPTMSSHPSEQVPLPLEVLRPRLRAPAGGLLIAGLITLLFAVTCILWSGWGLARHAAVPEAPQTKQQGPMTVTITPKKGDLPDQRLLTGLLATQVLAIAAGTLMLLAVMAMRKVEFYRLALLGSSLAMVPLSPAWLLGFPIGIWANLVLRRPGVRATFERPLTVETETAPDAGQQAAWLREWFGTATGWTMMLALLGGATTFLPWLQINTFGIVNTQAGFDSWHGIVTGCVFVGVFLALVAINFIKPLALLRAAATALGGAGVVMTVWAFLAQMTKPPEVSKPTGAGPPELMNLFGEMFKDVLTTGIQVQVLSGPYVTLGFGIALLVLCLWHVGEILVRARGERKRATSGGSDDTISAAVG
jgi:predicted Ser/Thr protein kinase